MTGLSPILDCYTALAVINFENTFSNLSERQIRYCRTRMTMVLFTIHISFVPLVRSNK